MEQVEDILDVKRLFKLCKSQKSSNNQLSIENGAASSKEHPSKNVISVLFQVNLKYILFAASRSLVDLITMTNDLANAVMKVTNKGNDLVVIGGDHSCAIGTWSGVARSCHHKGKIGLLWIDAHMDSHTCITSHTGNLHGMPVSHLLGYGDPRLSDILGISPKILPQNLALVGIRSFEPEEKALLEKHKVHNSSIDFSYILNLKVSGRSVL